jgi:hypothetical protein
MGRIGKLLAQPRLQKHRRRIGVDAATGKYTRNDLRNAEPLSKAKGDPIIVESRAPAPPRSRPLDAKEARGHKSFAQLIHCRDRKESCTAPILKRIAAGHTLF